MSAPGAADAAQDALSGALDRLAPRLGEGARGAAGLTRLSGGASQELWSFDLTGPDLAEAERGAILRRAPEGARPGKGGVGLETEAELIARARARGVPAPRVLHVLRPEDGLGTGFVMARVEGETLAPRILRKDAYAPARARFAEQAGETLAAIHAVEAGDLGLETRDPASAVEDLAARHAAYGRPRPVFELAIRHLRETAPAPTPPRLLHGDFRMGNLMFGPEGLRAVLDWELAHRGDPMSDLGWLCMESWRFGGRAPVGGLGARETLWAAYEAAGGAPVDPAAARWWETLSALHWGVIVEEMAGWVLSGVDRSIERHVIARRASEVELVLLSDLTGRAA